MGIGGLWIVAVLAGLGYGAYRWRWLRVVSIVIALLVVLAVALFQSVDLGRPTAGGGEQDTSEIQRYAVDYTVSRTGDQSLVETLDVEFTEPRRGIFRFYDESDGVDPDVQHPVTVESVERCPARDAVDCRPEPFEEYYESGYHVVKIGDADVTYRPGTVNRYVITSTTTGAITQPRGSGEAQWYWNVVAGGWAMPIRKADVSVTLPVQPTAVRCITDSGPCETTSLSAGGTVTGTYSMIPPFTPVTWQADLPPQGLSVVPVGEEPAGETPWWATWFLLVLGAVAAVVFFWWIRSLREPPADETPVFAEPTKDILPAVWTFQEKAPGHGFQTMLMQLRELGAVRVDVQTDGAYMSTDPQWVQVTRTAETLPMIAGASELVEGVGIGQPGSSVVIAKDDTEVGRRIRSTDESVRKVSDHAAEVIGYYHRSWAGTAANVLAAVLPLLAIIVAVVFGQWWMAGLALLIPSVAGLWAVRSLQTELTPEGLAIRDQVSGLRTALGTPASIERFDYSVRARYFSQFLPWAVALGCADRWAEICRPAVPPETSAGYDPVFLSAWNTYSASEVVSTAVASVSAGAVAAYAATQSSSGSGGGGGGFSSGGGSGDGGGGSW